MGRLADSEPPQFSAMHARGYAVQPGWRLLIQDVGLSPEAVLRRADLPADLLSRAEGSLDARQYFSLWEAIEAELQTLANTADATLDPTALRVARSLSADWFDPVLFSALCSADLIGALQRVAKYKQLICPMALEVDVGPETTSLRIHWLPAEERPPAVLVAFELAFFVQLARMATRTGMSPVRVVSPVAMTPAAAYTRYFGAEPVAGTPAQLVFRNADARQPFLTVNPRLWDFFEPHLRRRLAELGAQASAVQRLRSAFYEALPAGNLGMTAVSRKLGLSARTLQRRLREEGTSYQQTLDAVRGELAMHYLKHSSMSGAEISFLLGFEDPNSFVRAFQGWMGATPERVRQQLRAAGAAGASTVS